MKIITSIRNPALKRLRDLKKRAVRDSLRLAFVEGKRLVTEALSARYTPSADNVVDGVGDARVGPLVREIYVSKTFSESVGFEDVSRMADAIGLEPVMIPDTVFDAVSDTKVPQGIIAVIGLFDHKPSDLTAARLGRVLILDHMSDPGNLGGMLRTAAAAAFTGVIVSDGSADVYAPKTLRSAMGATFRIPFIRDAALPDAIDVLHERGYKVYASQPPAAQEVLAARISLPQADCWSGEIRADGGVALVIGGEAFGVSREVLSKCDATLYIPMPGGTESLNANVAAGILIYEIVRRSSIHNTL